MRPVVETFRAIAYLALLVFLGVLIRTTLTVGPKISAALDSIQAIETNTTRTEAELSGLLNVSRQIAIDERSASAKQLADLQDLTDRTKLLVTHADAAITDLDAAAKSMLTGAAVDEADLSKMLQQTTSSVEELSSNGDLVLQRAAQSLDPAGVQTAIGNLTAASSNVKEATADAASSMATVRKGVEFEVRQLTTPPRKIKWLAEETARMIGKFLGF